MKKYDRIILIFVLLIILTFIAVNMIFSGALKKSNYREYRVEINRLADGIERGYEADISRCSYVVAVVVAENSNLQIEDVTVDGDFQNDEEQKNNKSEFYNSNYDYVIKNINGKLYRFDYITNKKMDISYRIKINIFLIIIAFLMLSVLLYIRKQILTPFNVVSEIPAELAKGNLTVPIKENKTPIVK